MLIFLSKIKKLEMFYREFATMLNSGIDIIKAADIVSTHAKDKELKAISSDIRRHLAGGGTLSEAISEFPQSFPKWHFNIIRHSEIGGKLDEGLFTIADYLQKDYDVQKKLIIGLAYPFILLHLAIFLFPLAQLITGDPLGYFFQVFNVFLALYSIFFLIYLLKRLFYLDSIKRFYDAFILKVPVFGGLYRRVSLARFIRSLKCLYDSGVNITISWQNAVDICTNDFIKQSLLRALPIIEQGGQISEAFDRAKVFPEKVIAMIVAAQESGSLDDILEKIAQYYESENEMVVGVLLVTIPLFFYVMVACYIGYRIISFYLGYFERLPI